MTTPALSLINKIFPEKNIEIEYQLQKSLGIFKALIALGNPENGKTLLNVAKTVLDGAKNSLSVTVLHITHGTDINPIYGQQYAVDSFKQINAEAARLNIPIETEYKITDIIEQGIVRNVNSNNFDFLLVGGGLTLSGIPFLKENNFNSRWKLLNTILNKVTKTQVIFYPGTLIKDKTKYFIENSECSVGVFVNHGFSTITTTLILLHAESDSFLLRYARRLLRNNSNVSIFLMDVNGIIASNKTLSKAIDDLKSTYPNSVKTLKNGKNNASIISKFSFMMISYPTWNILSESENRELATIPSTLIINKKPSRFNKTNQNGLTQTEFDYFEE